MKILSRNKIQGYKIQTRHKSQTTNPKQFVSCLPAGRQGVLFLGICLFLVSCFLVIAPKGADAATLRLSPAQGEFEVGETFDVDVLLNTEGETINTLQASISFPPDMLQIASPSSDTSIIGVWTAGPRFDNSAGTAEFQGIIPGGINVDEGLVARITFRAVRPGGVFVQFSDESAVLLHDGQGTHALRQTANASYDLVLPPPGGPVVSSDTHPDQEKWYNSSFVSLSWENEQDVQGYSYVLDREPATTPDNISQGSRTSTTYEDISDGTHYFHIRALRDDVWGGVTHYALNIDTSPPADFDINITPSARTANRQPVINFSTTDSSSGFDFYEIKIVPLQGQSMEEGFEEFFIQTTSPFNPPPLELGTYDVIVRAHDKAGNFREATQRLEITTDFFTSVTRKGIEIRGELVISWIIIFLILGFLLFLLGIAAKYFYDKHKEAHEQLNSSSVPPALEGHKKDMEQYRATYNKQPTADNHQQSGNDQTGNSGPPQAPTPPQNPSRGPGNTGSNLVVLIAATAMALSFNFAPIAFANSHEQEEASDSTSEEIALSPPIITTISENIFNNEIFYAGGNTDIPEAEIVLYLQNLRTGATVSNVVEADEEGRWFYRHDSFLSSGRYLLWTQSRMGETSSPPSSQEQITVNSAALSIGASRVSYEDIYLASAVALLVALVALAWFVIHHRKHAAIKREAMMSNIHKTERELRDGFSELYKDIQAELDIINKAKLNKGLSEEQKEQEKQLLQDLKDIEKRLEGDLWKIEHNN